MEMFLTNNQLPEQLIRNIVYLAVRFIALGGWIILGIWLFHHSRNDWEISTLCAYAYVFA